MDNSTALDITKPRSILVLGANGFIGRYLCEFLSSREYRVIQADKAGSGNTIFDALQPKQVMDLIGEIQPDVIFNLIGYTNEEHPDTIYKLNIFPLINIVKSAVSLGIKPRIITMGSAAEYGSAGDSHFPLKEDDLKLPLSHYGVSKATQTSLAGVLFRSNGSDIIIARPFNIIGYGMSLYSVPACFVVQFLKGLNREGVVEIRTGDLSPVRDFLTVHDVVNALHCIMLRGSPGESYNICSGAGITIQSILTRVASNFSEREYLTLEKKGVNAGNTIHWSVGNNSKLKTLGWKQTKSLDEGIRDIVRFMQETPGILSDSMSE